MKKKLFLFGSLGLFACFQNCAQVANNSIQFSSDVPLCVDLNPDAFAPKVKWDWYKLLDKSSSDTYPNISQVMAAPMVADLNADGAPEVVFVSWSTTVKDSYRGAGVLRIVDGRTGQTLKSIGDDNLAPYASTSPLLIDIDGDGKVEIFYSHYSGTSVVALNSDGTLRWKHSVPDLPTDKTLKNQTGFSAFDIDGDGKAEILIGQWAISEDSAKKPFQKWKAQAWVSPASAFAINLDASRPNQVRIVASNGVYDLDGDLVFTLPNSRYSAGDIDGTPGLELVGTGGGYLRIADGVTGNIKLDKDLSVHNELRCPLGIGGGPSTLGDFDGNPQTSEIALATGRYLTIFDGSGSLIAKYATQDCSSLVTGISSFDFNGDGKPEILYGDEEYLRVFEIVNGELRVVWSTVNPSGTLNEYPVVADVDGNGSSELLVISNNYNVKSFYKDPNETADAEIAKSITGLRVFEPVVSGTWMPTRNIWNSFDYNPAFVTDKGRAVSSTSLESFTAKLFRRNAQLGMFERRCVQR